MAFEFLDTNWLGNSWLNYMIFLGIIVGGIIVGKIFYWISTNIIKKIVSKTKTQLDDLLIDALERPVIFLIFIVSAQIAKGFLDMTEGVASTVNNIISILYTLDIAWFIMNILDSFIVNYLQPATAKTKTDLDDTLIPIVRKALKFVIIAVAIVMIIDNFGYDVTSIVAGLGLGGLAFALAAQDLLKNLFGGLAILTDKPFKVGQRVKIDDKNDGWIREIGLRTTRMETFDGTMIVIPNHIIADTILENVSRESARRIKVTIGLVYDTPTKKLEKAKQIIADVIKENEDTKDESLVSFFNFGDSALELLVIYWIKNKDNILGARDKVNFEIKKRFEKAKLDMAYPTQTIYVKK